MIAMVSPDEFAEKMRATARHIEKAESRAVVVSAQTAKTVMVASGRAARIPDPRKWGVRWVMTKNNSAVVFYRGARPYWTEFGTKPHTIIPKSLGKSRRARTALAANLSQISWPQGAVLAFDGVVTRYARHPGAKPRPFWANTVKHVDRAARAAQKKLVRDAFAKEFL